MTDIIDQLKQVSHNLLWMSESEFPFEVFVWSDSGTKSADKIRQLTHHAPETPVEVMGLNDFFALATKEEDWHDEAERATVKRYQQLVEMLKTKLKDIQVYRLGKRNMDVYIVGTTSDGSLAGLSTKAVET